MKKIDPIVLGIIIILVILVGGIIAASGFSSGSSAPSYQPSDSNRPKMEISERNFDFGKINVDDVKTKDITVKNIGEKPLNLSNFSTSCGCTTVEVRYGDKKSPEFSLHDKFPWQVDIEPGKSAALTIKYEPKSMPVFGDVSRVVYFKTNDPDNPNAEIIFKTFVEK